MQFLENGSSRMILLVVGETQVPHVLAEDVDAVGVLAARARSAHLFHSRNNSERYVERHNWVLLLVIARLRAEVKTIIGDSQCAPNRAAVRADVSDVVLEILPFLAGQVAERTVAGNLAMVTRMETHTSVKQSKHKGRLTVVSPPCFEFNDEDFESESSELELAFFDAG